MRADILIVGQGLAGTMLGWACERAGISFAVVDTGHAGAATTVAAGIINPITGRRLVKSWEVDRLLPLARATYRDIEAALGVPVWREMRVWRRLADERERRVLAEKRARGWMRCAHAGGHREGCARRRLRWQPRRRAMIW